MSVPYSQAGDTILGTFDKADHFTNWLYAQISPYLQGNILEIGSGLGTYSQKIIRDFPQNQIVLSDIDTNYVTALGQTGQPNVTAIKLDISQSEDFKNLLPPINSAFALNVLEHIEADVAALQNVYEALEPGGRFIILVPAHQFLFNCIDTGVGHFRRYNRKSLTAKIEQTPFRLKKMSYFNCLAMLGWYWNGRILKRPVLDESAISLFNRLVPYLKPFEKYLLRQKIGISLIAVLEK